MYNALEFSEKLIAEGGLEERAAKTIANGLHQVMEEELPSKRDLAEMEQGLRAEIRESELRNRTWLMASLIGVAALAVTISELI